MLDHISSAGSLLCAVDQLETLKNTFESNEMLRTKYHYWKNAKQLHPIVWY